MIEVDRNGFEVLSVDECLRLLGTVSLGRVATHTSALPIILPVQFALAAPGIVFRTNVGTKLNAAARNAVVAFEADHIDERGRFGWSVLVTGLATEITDPAELAEARSLTLGHLATRASRYVSISLGLVSGRRSLPQQQPRPP